MGLYQDLVRQDISEDRKKVSYVQAVLLIYVVIMLILFVTKGEAVYGINKTGRILIYIAIGSILAFQGLDSLKDTRYPASAQAVPVWKITA